MSNKVLCPICGQEVEPMAVGNKKFCPSCEADITDVQPAAPEKPSAQPVETAPAESPAGGHVIKDGMGMIEEKLAKKKLSGKPPRKDGARKLNCKKCAQTYPG